MNDETMGRFRQVCRRNRPIGPRWYEDLVIPVLLHEGRETYARAIRAAFADEGFEHIPRLGPRLLGGMQRFSGQPGDIATDFGISKQAASKLVDALVVRGYLERDPDPEHRRRILLTLTERGEAAAKASWAATRPYRPRARAGRRSRLGGTDARDAGGAGGAAARRERPLNRRAFRSYLEVTKSPPS